MICNVLTIEQHVTCMPCCNDAFRLINITFLNDVKSFADRYLFSSKVFSVTLFDKEEIHQDLHLIVAESQDESTLVVYGEMYVPRITIPLGLFILYQSDFHSRMSFVPE